MASGELWKIIVTQHSPPLHQEMQPEIVLCKRGRKFIHLNWTSDSSCHMWRYHWCENLCFGEIYAAIKTTTFPQELHVYFSRTMPCHELQQRGFVGRVRVLDWPVCSPDLCPIENIWCIMKRRMIQRPPQTVEQLKSCISQEWAKIPLFIWPWYALFCTSLWIKASAK